MMRKPAKRRRIIACAPTPPCGSIADSVALLQAARARGILAEHEFDIGLKLLLRRYGLVPTVVLK
jgi:hypothetical protein